VLAAARGGTAVAGDIRASATGKPLPIGLPITTMSGAIPDAWKLHRCVPDRP